MKNKFKQLLLKLYNKLLAIGLLGAYSGAEGTSKAFRRFGIPLLVLTFSGFYLKDMRVFWVLSMILPLSMGYGVPEQYQNKDKGSFIGKIYYKLTKSNHYLTNLLTRGTIGLLVSLSLIVIPIIKGNWLVYIISSLIIVGVYTTLSWRDLGMFEWRGKKLLKSEAVVYGTLLTMIKWMI